MKLDKNYNIATPMSAGIGKPILLIPHKHCMSLQSKQVQNLHLFMERKDLSLRVTW